MHSKGTYVSCTVIIVFVLKRTVWWVWPALPRGQWTRWSCYQTNLCMQRACGVSGNWRNNFICAIRLVPLSYIAFDTTYTGESGTHKRLQRQSSSYCSFQSVHSKGAMHLVQELSCFCWTHSLVIATRLPKKSMDPLKLLSDKSLHATGAWCEWKLTGYHHDTKSSVPSSTLL